MTVAVVGLGLIGGSIAKAYAAENHTVYALDTNETILEFAMLSEVVSDVLTEQTLPLCDLIILSIYPDTTVEYLTAAAPYISKEALVIDCCGTKEQVCKACFAIAAQYGFTFVGGHPMAGSHNAGFKHSRADLFVGAPMVMVPPVYDDMALLDRVKRALSPLRFGSFSVTDGATHDKMIAFTSQMAHIVSNAYVKSPQAKQHKGFSAGSYKDLTRVAWLNAAMWSELFMNNKEHLLQELDLFIENITAYRDALRQEDRQKLFELLEEGRKIKGEIDG